MAMPDSDSGALHASTLPVIDLQGLGFDAGAHLLVKHALAALPVGGQLRVTGSAPGWQAQLSGWCSDQGHGLRWEDGAGAAQAMAIVARGGAQSGRWRGAAQTGRSDARAGGDAVAAQAQPFWGLAARGAQVEAGAPAFHFRLSDKLQVWTDSAADLYAQAVAAQWNADTDIDWCDAPELPAPVEDAIVQLMTYMVENENAALLVPARFLGQLHPHYRELQAALAIQVADEARHIDVFTRRIRRHGREPALSTAGGQASLKSLLDETDFSVAGFLLSVLGEGTFVHLLQFLQTEAPDPLTRQICRLAARDEARHVALGMSHLLYRLQHEPGFQHQLAQAVEQRFDNLAGTSGLNEEVFDALILIAAGALTPEALARGAARVQQLMRDMADGRFSKLLRLGFEREHAERLASLHTRNFM
ncbi:MULTISPECIES: ferritin-like domain-containing protein [unclassified Delftia]|uniref:ferritin-like domain-containing protein n=1 Tax=unclassified Delftia TaxID=2613839 RepID=UPI0019003E8C|nr:MULTISPECIES: ferritin-like domain-containing protein [unclassified Delftia]MBK0111216.1 ferritin-like domain-containing protein [Delftia sp. S65]MBK0117014.1 ferritin-like domain-containing protein [Delftia sp. S67]MBK0128390.1 ferritin-like domain-containing protein [Delftia sp. S66]